MADTFRNPYNYTSPIGAALADLARTVISGPSRAEKIKAAEEMLKVKRANESLLTLQTQLGSFGSPDFNLPAAAAAAAGAGVSGADLGDFNLLLTADGGGDVDAAFRGAGGAYSGTQAGFNTDQQRMRDQAAATLAETGRHNRATEANDLFKFNNDPYAFIGPDGPVIGTKGTAPGNAPIMSETDTKGYFLGDNWGNIGDLPPAEQTILGARGTGAPTPRNYVNPDNSVSITYDGVTDAQTGMRLAPGGYVVAGEGAAGDAGLTTSVRGGLQNQQIAIDRAGKMLDYVEQLAMKDPTNFGATAWVKGLGQDVGQLAQNVAAGLGFNGIQDAIAGVQQDALRNGVNPTVIQRVFNFDPTLGELQGAYGMLVYALASGIAGQEGRDLSDADVQRATAAFGNPNAFFASQQSVLSRLQAARQMLGINKGVVNDALGGAPAAPALTGVYDKTSPTPPPNFAPGKPESVRIRAWEIFRGG